MRKISGFLFLATVLLMPPVALYNSDFGTMHDAWKNGFARFLIFTYLAFASILILAFFYRLIRSLQRRRVRL